MATTKGRSWPIILGIGGVLLFIGWIVSGHWITGLAALFLLLAMAGGALLYRFQGPPER
jgi:hypothetical protein